MNTDFAPHAKYPLDECTVCLDDYALVLYDIDNLAIHIGIDLNWYLGFAYHHLTGYLGYALDSSLNR